MKSFLKSRGCWVLVAIAVLLCMLPFSKQVISAAICPLQTAVSEAVNTVRAWGGGELRRENEALRSEIATLRAGQTELDALRRENAWYHTFLELKATHPDYQLVQAHVIARDPADAFGNVTLGCGSNKGVEKGDTVITGDGLVGVVQEVFPTSATVRTLLDPQLPLSVFVSRTQEHGITSPTSTLAGKGLLAVTRLERSAKAREGDIVVTYGSAKCPAGLLVGEFTKVYAATDGVSLTGTVRPFVDPFRVTDVMVIVDFAR